MIAQLLPVLLASVVLAAAPGPDTLLTIRTSAHGLAQGVRYAAGVAVGISVWGVAALVLLRALLQRAPWVLTAVSVAGGLFLVGLGVLLARQALAARASAEPVPGPRRPGMTGLMSSLSNPKTGMIFLAVFPQALPGVITPTTAVLVPVIPALTVGAWLTGLSLGVCAAGARVRAVLTSSGVEIGAGALFVLLGVGVAASAA